MNIIIAKVIELSFFSLLKTAAITYLSLKLNDEN